MISSASQSPVIGRHSHSTASHDLQLNRLSPSPHALPRRASPTSGAFHLLSAPFFLHLHRLTILSSHQLLLFLPSITQQPLPPPPPSTFPPHTLLPLLETLHRPLQFLSQRCIFYINSSVIRNTIWRNIFPCMNSKHTSVLRRRHGTKGYFYICSHTSLSAPRGILVPVVLATSLLQTQGHSRNTLHHQQFSFRSWASASFH